MNHRLNKEDGLVSILTVIMFMIFISIMVVGFIKIMSDEQRQATDNDLSASALAAAQSGVEDAKRIILHCINAGPADPEKTSGRCNNFLTSKKNPTGECDILKGSVNGLLNAMGINYNNATNEAQVGDASFNQYYTCINVESDPESVEKVLTEGKSEIIPLQITGDYNALAINWSSSSGAFANAPASLGSDFPQRGSWTGLGGARRPPVIRAQIIPYTTPISNLDTVEQNSDTLFLVPSTAPPAAAPAQDSVGRTADNRDVAGSTRPTPTIPIVYTACTTGGSGYDCNIEITGMSPSTEQYYLRLSLLYGDATTVSVTPRGGPPGTPPKFNNVQYVIDVTGRTNDVYRRVQARVSPASAAAYPEYAIDTGGRLCKEIVTADVANTSYCPSAP